MMRLTSLLVLLLGFALRVHRLGHQELRGDEAFGYFFSLRSFGGILRDTLALGEPHPVASYFVQKTWMALAGDSEFALRFTSAWFSVLAVALILRLARALNFTKFSALLAAALLALSPYAIWHAQDARMYSMSLALTLASTWLAVEWLRLPCRRWAVAYMATSWLALHTHYFAAFVLIAQNLFVFVFVVVVTWVASHLGSGITRKRPAHPRRLLSWLSLQFLVALFYLPWLLRARSILSGYSGNGDSPGWLEMWRRALGVFAVGETLPAAWRTGLVLVVALLLLFGAWRLWRRAETQPSMWLLLLYLTVPLLITWGSAQQRPIFDERYLIAAAPPFYLLVAASRQRVAAPSRRLLLSVPLLALGIAMGLSLARHYTDPAYSKTIGWRDLAQTLTDFSAQLPPAEVRLVQNFPDPVLWYYYRGPVEHLVLPPAPRDVEATARLVDDLASAGVQRVLFVAQPAANWDDSEIAASALAAAFAPVIESTVAAWPLRVYTQPPALTPVEVPFENGLTLTGYAAAPEKLVAAGALSIALQWRGAPANLLGTEKVFLHLVDGAGNIVAQADQLLVVPDEKATWMTSYGILLPTELADGPHRLLAGLYDPAQDGAPRILTASGVDAVELRVLEPVK